MNYSPYLAYLQIMPWIRRDLPVPETEQITPNIANHPAEKPSETLLKSDQQIAVITETQTKNPHCGDLTWEALQQKITECQGCILAKTRQKTVFGQGHRHARLMLIGEGPGAEEDREGLPFVGASGQLLDKILESVGLSRHNEAREYSVFLANIVKCRPPDNRNPYTNEMMACQDYLARQIELVKPDYLLAVGKVAANHLLQNKTPIGKLRGNIHYYQNIPLFITFHPAYLLRNPSEKATVWRDLQALARELKLPNFQ